MTLEDIQHKLLAYYLPLRRRLSLLIIAGGLVAALMFLYALTKETYFVATATFHPEKTSKSSNFSLDPVALILGGAGGGGGSGHEEMSGVLSSRKLSEIVAADTFFHNGKRQLLADIVLEKYFDLFTWQRAIWLDRETIEDYTYEDKIITTGRMLRGALHVEVDDYGFMMMSLTAADPILVKEVADTYIDELIDYYQEQQTEKAQTDFDFFDKRVKTIRLRLDSVVNFIAGYYDTRKYRTQATAELIVKKKEAEAEYLQQVLQQLLLSREQANS